MSGIDYRVTLLGAKFGARTITSEDPSEVPRYGVMVMEPSADDPSGSAYRMVSRHDNVIEANIALTDQKAEGKSVYLSRLDDAGKPLPSARDALLAGLR